MASNDPLFELGVPPDAREKGGHEVLSAWIVDGAVSVALRRSFEDPATWGLLLVDVARQAARVYALETDVTEDEAFEEIRSALRGELDDPSSADSPPHMN
jgi:hypothetical protein